MAETSRKREDWAVFKAYQKVLAKELWDARLTSFKCDMDKRDAKKRWKVVKQHAGLPSKTGENSIELVIDGEKITDPMKVATTLNNYFKDKVVTLRRDLNVSVRDSLSYTDKYLADKEVKTVLNDQIS